MIVNSILALNILTPRNMYKIQTSSPYFTFKRNFLQIRISDVIRVNYKVNFCSDFSLKINSKVDLDENFNLDFEAVAKLKKRINLKKVKYLGDLNPTLSIILKEEAFGIEAKVAFLKIFKISCKAEIEDLLNIAKSTSIDMKYKIILPSLKIGDFKISLNTLTIFYSLKYENIKLKIALSKEEIRFKVNLIFSY